MRARPAGRPARASFMTPMGRYFSLAALAIGLAAFNTGNNLCYLLLSVMLAFLILSLALAIRGLPSFEVARIIPRHIHAGEAFPVTLVLRRRSGWLPLFSARVTDLLEGGQVAGTGYLLQMGPRSKVECAYRARLGRRGVYQLEGVRMESSFPFGFFRRVREIPCPGEILVYPQTLPCVTWAAWSPVPIGEQQHAQKGMGTDLYGLRDYQQGDSARLIHWKVSARTQRLVAREFETEEKKRLTLLLDNGVAMPSAPAVIEAFERAVVAAASLASAYLDLGYQVQLQTRTGRAPIGSGLSQKRRILRALAHVQLTRHRGALLWHPHPSRDETHVAIQFNSTQASGQESDVLTLSVMRTPPFSDLTLAEQAAPAPV